MGLIVQKKTVDTSLAADGKSFFGIVRSIRAKDLEVVKAIIADWEKDGQGQPRSDYQADVYAAIESSLAGTNGRSYFVAEDLRGNILGVIGCGEVLPDVKRFITQAKAIELFHPYVSQKNTGQGIGTALFNQVESTGRSQGCAQLIISSKPWHKDTAWGFYDNLPNMHRIAEYGGAPIWQQDL